MLSNKDSKLGILSERTLRPSFERAACRSIGGGSKTIAGARTNRPQRSKGSPRPALRLSSSTAIALGSGLSRLHRLALLALDYRIYAGSMPWRRIASCAFADVRYAQKSREAELFVEFFPRPIEKRVIDWIVEGSRPTTSTPGSCINSLSC
jgi:hypothetical protein